MDFAIDLNTKDMRANKLAAYLAIMAALAIGGSILAVRIKPINGVEQAVKSMLKDPDSAAFSLVKVYPDTGAACGMVNAKNSLGGYVGSWPFVFVPGKGATLPPDEAGSSASTAEQIQALTARIEFIQLIASNCPDWKASGP